MPGYGDKVVTLADDKAVHILAEGERTECGLPIPIAGGAEWTYANRDGQEATCKACLKSAEKFTEAFEEPAPFDEGVEPLADEELPSVAPEPKKAAKRGKTA